jgi:predicted TIM-barrel fold metal-dependent hydrolase
MGIVDCHAHIIDPERFSFADGPGYRPRPDELGPRESYNAVLDRHGVTHALLVQPSGYGFDNAAMLDAIADRPERFKGIAVIPLEVSDSELDRLAAGGVVGVRFNLASFQREALSIPSAPRLLARLRERNWFVQIYAFDEQWPELAPLLRASGVTALIDHFGVRDLAAGPTQAGFQAVLALGREGRAVVKMSGSFRSAPTGDDALVPYAAAVVAAFGLDRCVWGSDWPFLDIPGKPVYADALAPLQRWLPDAGDRDRVLCHSPAALFGFAATPKRNPP